jgi:hypothetical protein
MLYDPSAGRVAGLSLNFLVRKNEVLVEHMDMPRENGVIWAFLDKLEEGYDVFQHTGDVQVNCN